MYIRLPAVLSEKLPLGNKLITHGCSSPDGSDEEMVSWSASQEDVLVSEDL